MHYTHNTTRAQGTIEYLVIVAVVVVISLVVVGLMTGIFSENSANVNETAQKLSLTTKEIGIKDFVAGTTDGGDTNAVLVIQNNSGETIQQFKVYLDGKEHPYDSTTLASGSSLNLILTAIRTPCAEGDTTKNMSLTIGYTSQNGIDHNINYGTVSVACTATPTALNPTQENLSSKITLQEFRFAGQYNPRDISDTLYDDAFGIIIKNEMGFDINVTALDVTIGNQTATLPAPVDGSGTGRPFVPMKDYGEGFGKKISATPESSVANNQIIGFNSRGHQDNSGERFKFPNETLLPGDTVTATIIIHYEHNGTSGTYTLSNISTTVEAGLGDTLYSYYNEDTFILEPFLVAFQPSAGDIDTNMGVAFKIKNNLATSATINQITISGAAVKDDTQDWPTFLPPLQNSYWYSFIKMTDGVYPAKKYYEAQSPPISTTLAAGESNGFIHDKGDGLAITPGESTCAFISFDYNTAQGNATSNGHKYCGYVYPQSIGQLYTYYCGGYC